MPAVSKAQQRFMGMVHAADKGETPASPEVAKVSADMKDSDAKDFASTKHDGLPDHVKEQLKSVVREVIREKSGMNEMSSNDVHFKHIMKLYDRGGSFTRKKIGAVICKDPKASRKDVEEELFDADYRDILEFEDELGLKEIREKYSSVKEDAAELPPATIPAAVKAKLQLAIDKIKDSKLSNNAKLQLLAQVIDAIGIDKSQLSTIASKIRSKMESVVTEEFKHVIHVDTPTQVVSKPVAAQIMALAKKGVRASEIGLEMGFVGNAKLAADTFQKVKNKIYFELDKRNESVNEALDPKAEKFLDAIQVNDRSIKDLKNITVDATPQGNWSVYYKGKRMFTLNGKMLDDKTIMKYGLEHMDESINELTSKEKRIKDGNPDNVFYIFYKGQFDIVYWAMNPSDLFNIYWDEFKVRRPSGSQFKLNPEFIIVSKKEYDKNTSNHYAKLKPYVDKFWDKLQNESVNEAKFKSPDYIISTTPASSLPQQKLGHADVMIGLKLAEKLKNYTLHVRHYKLVHADGKVALKLTPEGKTAVRVRTEDDPKYLQLIQKTVNDVVADYVSKIKESVNEEHDCGCNENHDCGCGGVHEHTHMHEDLSADANGIAGLTASRANAVKDFLEKNNINSNKLYLFLKKGNLKDRMDFVTALVGKPGNPIQKKVIAQFSN